MTLILNYGKIISKKDQRGIAFNKYKEMYSICTLGAIEILSAFFQGKNIISRLKKENYKKRMFGPGIAFKKINSR